MWIEKHYSYQLMMSEMLSKVLKMTSRKQQFTVNVIKKQKE